MHTLIHKRNNKAFIYALSVCVVCVYIHTYMHTYHPYAYTSIHTYIQSYTNSTTNFISALAVSVCANLHTRNTREEQDHD